jgi:hypothetical protein
VSSAVTRALRRRTSRKTSTPASRLVIAIGRKPPANPAPRGSFASSGTTSLTGTRGPSPAAAWVSSVATAGEAAEAMCTSGPAAETRIAPYTSRLLMAASAAAASATGRTAKAPGWVASSCAVSAGGPAIAIGRSRGARLAAGAAKSGTRSAWAATTRTAMSAPRAMEVRRMLIS